MTKEDRIIVISLDKCTYLPGSFEKRFARDIAYIAKNNPDYELTEKQRKQLYRQLKRYRRQIPKTFNRLHPEGNEYKQLSIF